MSFYLFDLRLFSMAVNARNRGVKKRPRGLASAPRPGIRAGLLLRTRYFRRIIGPAPRPPVVTEYDAGTWNNVGSGSPRTILARFIVVVPNRGSEDLICTGTFNAVDTQVSRVITMG